LQTAATTAANSTDILFTFHVRFAYDGITNTRNSQGDVRQSHFQNEVI